MTSNPSAATSPAPGPSTGADEPHRLPIRTLVAASVGNAVEWYD